MQIYEVASLNKNLGALAIYPLVENKGIFMLKMYYCSHMHKADRFISSHSSWYIFQLLICGAVNPHIILST